MDDGKYLTDLKAELEKLRNQIREFEHISNQNINELDIPGRHPWRNDLILHNSPDGLALLGLDGKIIDANPALCRILGYPLDELIGIDIRILEAREDSDETTDHLKRIAKEGGDRFETRLRRKDGHIIDAEINTNSCQNGDERFFITFTQDITHRKQAEEALRESEEKYRTLVEMSPYAIAIFQDDKLVFANQTAERLIVGGSGEKIISRNGFEMVSDHDRDRLRDYAKKRYQGDSSAPNHYRVDLIRANGEIDRKSVV
jgi:two-component system cell cycle sensor histidine kinase/response regulator CckA